MRTLRHNQNILKFQFDQSDLLLPSAEYYQLGFDHPIIQSYYNVLFNVATLLGADPTLAKREMKDLIEFEMNLASVRKLNLFSVHEWKLDIFFISTDHDSTP